MKTKESKDNTLTRDEHIEWFEANVDYGGHKMWERNEVAFNNAPNHKYDEQCCICNKGMNTETGKGYITRGYTNPLSLVHKKDHDHLEKNLRGSDMGSYFVGSECGKKIKKSLIDAGLNWKDYIYYFDDRFSE
tara:strand:- start:75 stop:473 length:399 start_codon:yes stop_codon:yes gene_type:complete